MSTIRDFPDYMYPNGAAPAVLFSGGFTNSGLVTVLQDVDVSSWPCIQITFDMFGTGGGSTHTVLRLNWSNPNDAGTSRPFKNIRQVGGVVYESCWNYGSRLTLQIDPEPGAGTFSGTLHVVARGGMPGPMTGVGTLINQPTVATAAFAVVTVNALFATPGPAIMVVGAGQTAWVAILEMLAFGGIWSVIDVIDARVGGFVSGRVQTDLPSSQCRITFANGAAAGNCNFALTPRGY